MKRSELVRQLTDGGCVLQRHGSRHDIYLSPANGKKHPVPRHTEIDDTLARHLKRQLGLER
ncbi:MAG: type II toxin-antitoxin system HicA family toxin [Deltaproteobacteria bacterium]|nr:type II toxin-antitoxin system HicA family toxin [Deltaproteobacteria bacterium]